MTTERRSQVFITVRYLDEDVYSECSINEVSRDEMHLLMPELVSGVSKWAKEEVKDRIEQIQSPAYTHQQSQLTEDED